MTDKRTRQPAPFATIRDVADRAGVSIGTVSRVLNNTSRVHPDKAARVRAAVAELNYVPNIAAQNMRRAATRMVACIVTDIANPLYARLVGSLQRALYDAGYSMVVLSTGNVASRELDALATARRHRFDGIVYLTGWQDRAEVNKAIEDLAIPTVQIERERPTNDCFCVDHATAARQAAQHLAAFGHRRIGLVTPSRGARPSAARIDAFLEFCAETGIADAPDLVREVDGPVDSAFNATFILMRRPEPPTAIITLGSQLLSGVLHYIESEGLSIPADLSIVSIGDNELTRAGTPPITAIDWDFATVGEDAVARLIARIDAARAEGSVLPPPNRTLYPTSLLPRASVAPPRAGPPR
ncbi:LacI family DNA-binding transcriptional regulator [Acuticoccus mangrovi]|uniref:LacI family DNA-binding transcriptional regulator n=1 Tax=Acuticoccus mangrovi TaxID=2796142 RepID=A0A934MGN4_9HYPH|nr:LacI family DNA-binding transcriptional regulator [Acuticoccus mangrovi]MBJ3776095.1 LacI family DNA-binding transcriptional regulator [Acuticoccus mangrovi]